MCRGTNSPVAQAGIDVLPSKPMLEVAAIAAYQALFRVQYASKSPISDLSFIQQMVPGSQEYTAASRSAGTGHRYRS